MRVGNVEITNFQSIGDIKFNLTNKGLVLIEGDNRDDPSQKSNGSGKSSIPDALDWCLYDVTARGQTGDDVIHNVAKKGTRVFIELIDDDDTVYHVSRHRKHKEFNNELIVKRVDGETESNLTSGTNKLTQVLLNKILGCSEYVFKNAVYLGQDDMPELPALTDKPLKVLIEEAAGIEDIQKASDIAVKDFNKAKTAAAAHQSTVGAVISRLEDKQEDLIVIRASVDKWELDQKERQETEKAELKEIAVAIKGQKATHEAIDMSPVETELAEVLAAIRGVEVETARLKELGDEAAAASKTASKIHGTLAALKAEYDRLAAQVRNIDKKVGTDCGECGKEYHKEDLATALETMKRQLSMKADAFKSTKAEFDSANAVLAAAQLKRDEYASAMTDISKQVERERELNTQVNVYEESKRELARAVFNFRRKKESFELLSTSVNPHAKLIASTETQIVDLTEQLRISTEKTEELEKEECLAKEVVRVFGPAGVRAHILDTITPFLNSRTAMYLGTLSDGVISAVWSTISRLKSGEMTEKFAIDVRSELGASKYKGLSGGEKRKVKLACAMALQDLVASRAAKPFQLFMADEIDDGIDESGLERLMAILDEKSKDKGTVLVVSHHSLSDWIRQVVVMRKEGRYSSLDGEALN